MTSPTLRDFTRRPQEIAPGVVAVILCETALMATAAAERVAQQGAASIIAVGPGAASIPGTIACQLIRITDTTFEHPHAVLNALFDALAGRWVLWMFNDEFFVFPFGENRSLADLATFMEDERRRSVFTYALDLYADRLPETDADLLQASVNFDAIGYHVFRRENQQLRLFGALGWRFEEMVPQSAQQIGRTSFLKAEKGVHLNRDMMFGEPDLASVSCPWHNNLTAAMMTFRRTRRLFAHPNFPDARPKLAWAGTTPFDWTSEQLLSLGMIEPGQWF